MKCVCGDFTLFSFSVSAILQCGLMDLKPHFDSAGDPNARTPYIEGIFREAKIGCATLTDVLAARSEPKLTPWSDIIGNSFKADALPDLNDPAAITNFYNRLLSYIDADL